MRCPLCNGEGKRDKPSSTKPKYDQDAIWTKLRDVIPNSVEEKIVKQCIDLTKATHGRGSFRIIAHFLFERNVTPMGNLLMYHLSRASISGQPDRKLTRDDLRAKGYIVDDSGKVETVNDVPIGRGYRFLSKWLDSNVKRKHFNSAKIDPNRKGNPLFIDENMASVLIEASDVTRVKAALIVLVRNAYAKAGSSVVNLSLHLLPF